MHYGRAWAISYLLIATACVSCQKISEPESVLTQHNDRRRTGVYDHETLLTPARVSTKVGTTFGRLCVRKVEGQVAAQPLFIKGVYDGNQTRDLLIVATRKNFIYAFDANIIDQNSPNNGIAWGPIELTGGNRTLHAEPLKGMDDYAKCQQTHGPVGITSTPVVDPDSHLMYVVFRVAPEPHNGEYKQAVYFLAEIDFTNGQEISRTTIAGDPPAAAAHFDANAELNRPGLLLMKNPLTRTNVLYVAFGAPVCDSPRTPPFDGWVFAYAVPDLRLLDTYVTAPATHGAGIWQSGGGLAGASVGGAVYATTGNNLCPTQGGDCSVGVAESQTSPGAEGNRYDPRRTDLGESILKLKLGADDKFICGSHYGSFCVTDHFTAGNWFRLDQGYRFPGEQVNPKPGGDSDLGSGGPALLPNGWVIAGGKQGRMYVLNPSNMRDAKQGVQFSFNTWHTAPWHQGGRDCKTFSKNNKDVDDPQLHPECSMTTDDYDFAQAFGPSIHGTLVLWDNADPGFGLIYTMAEKDYVRAYRFFRRGDAVQVEEQPFTTTEGNSQKHPSGFVDLRSPDGMPGGALSLSANGHRDAILWALVSPCPDTTNNIRAGTLMAFDAHDLRLLWYEDGSDPNWLCAPPQNVDEYTTPPVTVAKFVPPTIAGGKVFRATFGDSTTCPNQKAGDAWISCGSVIFYGLRARSLKDIPPDISVRP